MIDKPEEQEKLDRICANLDGAIRRIQDASANLANQRPSKMPQLITDGPHKGQFKPEGTFER